MKHFTKKGCNEVENAPERSLTIQEWLTTDEAAEYLRVSIGSLRNMTSNGKIPFYKIPGTRLNRYRLADLRELLLSEKRGGFHGN